MNPFLIYPNVPGWRRSRINEKINNGERWCATVTISGSRKFIGEVKSNQGNHRLRKYLVTMLYEEHGLKVTLQYLCHAKEAVVFLSYIQQREERLPVVRRENLAAWGVIAKPV